MTANLTLIGFLLATFLLVVSKRVTALIRTFRLQSLALSFYVLCMAFRYHHAELFVVSALVFALKAIAIPYILSRIVRRIDVEEDLGLFINPQISLVAALVFAYLAYLFAHDAMSLPDSQELAAFTVSMTSLCIGFFIMASRMKALGQIIGLLVMENAIFLASSVIAGGMPFFAEIALFFDILVFVIIVEIFVYKVNRLFTHIDTSKMKSLKG